MLARFDMKSGDFPRPKLDDYSQQQLAQIADRAFVQRTFSAHAALVAKDLVNGHRVSSDYRGQPFDGSKFDLVEVEWDHEHCTICRYAIVDGHTYWENTDAIFLLCDACYEELGELPPAVKPD